MEQDVIHKTEWPMYLTLEQREQLLSEKIARAVAVTKIAAPQNIAYYGPKQPRTSNNRSKRHIFN